MRNFASMRFILFTSEIADFAGDLLRSFRQKSSVSVRSQNPTITRPKVDSELGLLGFMNDRNYILRLEIRFCKHSLVIFTSSTQQWK